MRDRKIDREREMLRQTEIINHAEGTKPGTGYRDK